MNPKGSAPRDDNYVAGIIAASWANPRLPVVLYADPTTHRLLVQATVTSGGDPLAEYQPADVDDSGTTKYYGFTKADGGWYILRENTAVSPKTYRYAAGDDDYVNEYLGRAALTYDYYHEVF